MLKRGRLPASLFHPGEDGVRMGAVTPARWDDIAGAATENITGDYV